MRETFGLVFRSRRGHLCAWPKCAGHLEAAAPAATRGRAAPSSRPSQRNASRSLRASGGGRRCVRCKRSGGSSPRHFGTPAHARRIHRLRNSRTSLSQGLVCKDVFSPLSRRQSVFEKIQKGKKHKGSFEASAAGRSLREAVLRRRERGLESLLSQNAALTASRSRLQQQPPRPLLCEDFNPARGRAHRRQRRAKNLAPRCVSLTNARLSRLFGLEARNTFAFGAAVGLRPLMRRSTSCLYTAAFGGGGGRGGGGRKVGFLFLAKKFLRVRCRFRVVRRRHPRVVLHRTRLTLRGRRIQSGGCNARTQSRESCCCWLSARRFSPALV